MYNIERKNTKMNYLIYSLLLWIYHADKIIISNYLPLLMTMQSNYNFVLLFEILIESKAPEGRRKLKNRNRQGRSRLTG